MKLRLLLPLGSVFLLLLSACAQVGKLSTIESGVSDTEEKQELKGEDPADKEDDGMEKTVDEVEKKMDTDENEDAMKEADKAKQEMNEDDEEDIHESADADSTDEDSGGDGR